jgi:hypothetical protein
VRHAGHNQSTEGSVTLPPHTVATGELPPPLPGSPEDTPEADGQRGALELSVSDVRSAL